MYLNYIEHRFECQEENEEKSNRFSEYVFAFFGMLCYTEKRETNGSAQRRTAEGG